jgi:hypothetical protein
MRYARVSLMLILVFFAGLSFECGKTEATAYPSKETMELKNIVFSGVRSSQYGIKPFPEPEEWQNAIRSMTGYFPGSAPCAIWIVGEFRRNKACHLYFPSEGEGYPNIEFESLDRHEKYLDFFDRAGIKVFLQVEPASADMPTLIDIVLGRYKHHPCVIGFGVDVEWYRESENPEWGVPVDDETAEIWDLRVKSHNPSYRLFLKHWDRNWMPANYRGNIIFISDSQIFKSFDPMLEEFKSYWAAHFYPNTVFFQIGYKSDKPWWRKMKVPPEYMGKQIAQNVKQECGIFWVDFTLRDVLPLE